MPAPAESRFIKVLEQLTGFNLMALALVIPLYRWMAPPLIALLGILWVIRLISGRMVKPSPRDILILLVFTGFYLLHVLSIFISENRQAAFFDLEVKASIVLFPLFLLTLPALDKRRKAWIFLAFVLGNLLASFICIGNAIFQSFYYESGKLLFNASAGDKNLGFFESITHGGNYFFYENLSYFRHPAYFTMYLTLAAVIVCEMLRERIGRFLPKWLLAIILGIFVVMILALLSRAGILAAFVVFGYYWVSYVFARFRIKQALLFSLLFVAGFAILIYLNPRFNDMAKSFISGEYKDLSNSDNQGSRISIWKTTLHLIGENWLTGVGTGDIHQELNRRYQAEGNQRALQQNLNVHNQFLETFAVLGISGFLCLMIILILIAVLTFREKNVLLIALFLLFLINGLFESILNTQAGVVFFMFFTTLLLKQDALPAAKE